MAEAPLAQCSPDSEILGSRARTAPAPNCGGSRPTCLWPKVSSGCHMVWFDSRLVLGAGQRAAESRAQLVWGVWGDRTGSLASRRPGGRRKGFEGSHKVWGNQNSPGSPQPLVQHGTLHAAQVQGTRMHMRLCTPGLDLMKLGRAPYHNSSLLLQETQPALCKTPFLWLFPWSS